MFKEANPTEIQELINFSDNQLSKLKLYIIQNIKIQFKDWEDYYIKTHSKKEIYDQSHILDFFKNCFHILTTETSKFLEVNDLYLKNFIIRLLLNDDLMYYLEYLYNIFLDCISEDFVSYEFISYYLYEFNEPDKLISIESLVKILNIIN